MVTSASVLLIGNELLSGKVPDANLHFFAQELFDLGIALSRAVVCRDDIEVIAAEMRSLRAGHDLVFTTGGVGPTHDDVTPEALALAVGMPLVHSKDILDLLEKRFGSPLSDGHRRLALMPEGADLLRSDEVPWPTVCADNIFMFPGVPDIVRRKWPPVRARLMRYASARHSRSLYLACDEFAIAAVLTETTRQFPKVEIGSYLATSTTQHKTKVTFDAGTSDAAETARDHFAKQLSADDIVGYS